jgi:acetyl-CoA/propionyl-CoA carboxylase biotin carboxyl carrier protein
LQRRHQKLVEEAPAPFLTDAQRDLLYSASKNILKEVGYIGAGTCEFLIGADGTITFLEVNTRLQVEHPVSEEVTGLDLVREQFRIAEGGLVDYPDPVITGHSIEFRINGEDAGANFRPTPGPVRALRLPGGPGIRVDSGVVAGDVISGSFDSLLAKLVVTGTDRKDALAKARRALSEFQVVGLPTVLPFHQLVVDDPAFAPAGDEAFSIYTSWIETEFNNTVPEYAGTIGASEATDTRHEVVVEVDGKRLAVSVPDSLLPTSARIHKPLAPVRSKTAHASAGGGNDVASPMQATVVKVEVAPGDAVIKGQTVVVLEAMKMEQAIAAPRDGVVAKVSAEVGTTVKAGFVLLSLEKGS